MSAAVSDLDQLLSRCRESGVRRGASIALALQPGIGVGLATERLQLRVAVSDPVCVVAAVEAAFRPRWTWWSARTAAALISEGVRVATCWDISAVHRLLYGGWDCDPATAWAALHGLAADSIPVDGQLDLLGPSRDDGPDTDDPERPDGHLRPEWAGGGWSRSPERLAAWAALALRAAVLQRARLAVVDVRGNAQATARAESAAELLCAEMSADGLPIDRVMAENIIASYVGPRPSSAAEAQAIRQERDAAVLVHAPLGERPDLRNPAGVKAMLVRAGIDIPDTRSWRLEVFRGAHPVVEPLLRWRKAERIATTYGYPWLEVNVGRDGRLRGGWTGSDGGAGRMTAQAGLHNLPAEMRVAVAAEPGQVLIRADLGQIEPRVLAAVSGDRALRAATQQDDLYAPVSEQLGVDRSVAKVAFLAAMYGQTSGTAGEALRSLNVAYPVAMRYLRTAYESGRAGRDVRTFGGRLVRMWTTTAGLDEAAERSQLAARGRFARNAVIQGAAAELFKAWAVTVRARSKPLDARIVLCLHDELLVQAPVEHGSEVARLLADSLVEAASGWCPDSRTRFVADVSVITRWSEATS
jgi:DNA polymerase-1